VKRLGTGCGAEPVEPEYVHASDFGFHTDEMECSTLGIIEFEVIDAVKGVEDDDVVEVFFWPERAPVLDDEDETCFDLLGWNLDEVDGKIPMFVNEDSPLGLCSPSRSYRAGQLRWCD